MAKTEARGQNDFFVTVSSNASTQFYPENVVAHFRNQLAEPLRLSEIEKWEVALSEIVCPPVKCVSEFSTEDLTVTLDYFPGGEHPDNEVRVTLIIGSFNDARTFAHEIHAAARTAFEKYANPLLTSFRVNLNPTEQSVVFKVVQNIYIGFSEKLWKILGLDGSCVGEEGHLRKVGSRHKQIRCTGFFDMYAGLHSLWVYSDCCEHRSVGGVRAPLFRTVVVKTAEMGDVIHRVYNRPYYLPVSQSYLPSLEMFITDNTGQKVSFFPGELVCTLHFRLRNT